MSITKNKSKVFDLILGSFLFTLNRKPGKDMNSTERLHIRANIPVYSAKTKFEC